MPRPGPRPYECVRRAWHSDRHQPIRGSLIQEIFRVASEVHSSATKKNKEWQEKLPVVVLKAEEIMYSKANSEAEYMDLKTLWDRTNDAINTIIRRDESTETGDLLQPCIEAALNLGCTPRRTSRSQRNCNPRCYLTPGSQDPNTLTPGMPNQISAPHCVANFSNFVKPIVMNSTHPGFEIHNLLMATNTGCLSHYNQSFPIERYPVSNLYSTYPLYYGSCIEAQQGLGVIPESISSTIETGKVGIDEDAAAKLSQHDPQDSPMEQHETGCDLSLRLGSLSASLSSAQNPQLQDIDDNSHDSSQKGVNFNNQTPVLDEKFSFPLDSRSRKLSEGGSVDEIMKKRKAVFGYPVDDQAYRWHSKLPCSDLKRQNEKRKDLD
ncbi:uncharacterized protein LOC126670598 [Mercurialis annua]|uniref:uncharacterized protein LOC126670598 n=1 Tax=Mercurialis annua TaxID=3986 RepID=UPI00215FC5C7|nr:uncharacterized protein LOC126670598 [Mercurialis annua]